MLNKPLSEQKIFIAITAFNDNFIKMTVDSALEKAKFPKRISFGIFEHRIDNNFFNFENYNREKLKHIKLNYEAMLGLGASRSMPFSLYNEEDFIFQIDAHMIFEKNWDEIIIKKFLEIQNDIKHNKIIISDRPNWWNFKEDNSIFFSKQERSENEMDTMILQNKNAGGYPLIYGEVKKIDDKKYFEHSLFSAHYVFSTPSFFQEIYLDPLITFGGEEHTMALRAWTRGYRLFNIKNNIIWHYNKSNIKDLNDRLFNPGNPIFVKHYNRKRQISLKRVKKILTGEILGYWGAPDLNLLKEYERKIDFDFKKFYSDIE